MVEIRGSVSLTINLSRRRERRRGGIIKRAKKGARGIVIAERETRKEGVEGWKETRRRLEGIRTNGKVVQLNRRKSGEEGRGDIPLLAESDGEGRREDLRKSAAASTLVTMDASVLRYTNNSQCLTKIMPAMIGRRYRASNPTGCFIWRA